MNKHIEAGARAYYDWAPNGYSSWEYVSTAPNAVRESVFHPDPWEECPDRHDKCAKTALLFIKAFIESFDETVTIASVKEIIEQAEKELKDIYPYG